MSPVATAEFPDAQVLSHPPIASFTTFPECLVAKYGGAYRLSWQPKSDRHLSMLRHAHIHPVYIEDIKDQLDALKREGYSRESLKDGMVCNGDCVLCYQPIEAHRQMQARNEQANRARSSEAKRQDALDNELQRLAALTGVRTGNKLVYETPYSNRDVDAHVDVNKVLRDPSGHRIATTEPTPEGV